MNFDSLTTLSPAALPWEEPWDVTSTGERSQAHMSVTCSY